MCVLDDSNSPSSIGPLTDDATHASGAEVAPAATTSASFFKAEANLLRFPLFALSTKGLRTLDGIECRGTVRRQNVAREFSLRVTRNTAELYPGPLARRLHFALLGLAAERGFPVKNPITWTWRELCDRMGIAYGGKTTLRQLKKAIQSIHGVVIHSSEAIYSRLQGNALPVGEAGYHLYSAYAFRNETRPDGSVMDSNGVWFADWFLDNLNAFFSAPLNYDLWLSLDRHGPITSRLYEYLTLTFHGGRSRLVYNYMTLARMLPITPMPFPSDARRQMGPALAHLVANELLTSFEWAEGRDGQLQLNLTAGPRLRIGKTVPIHQPADSDPRVEDAVQVEELRSEQPPAWFLVRGFYQQWSGDSFVRPSTKELELAEQIITSHGQTKATELVSRVVKRMRIDWPDAKTFGAISRFLPQATVEAEKAVRRAEREHLEQEIDEREKMTLNRRPSHAELETVWRPAFEALSEPKRAAIRKQIAERYPYHLRFPDLFERACWRELADRSKLVSPIATPTKSPADSSLVEQPTEAAAPAVPSAAGVRPDDASRSRGITPPTRFASRGLAPSPPPGDTPALPTE